MRDADKDRRGYLELTLFVADNIEKKRDLHADMLNDIIEYFAAFPLKRNLLEGLDISEFSHLDEDVGYDFYNAKYSAGTAVNMLYLGALKLAVRLGDERLRDVAERIEQAIIEDLYDKKVGLFRDASNSMHYSVLVNFLAIKFQIELPSGNHQLAAYIKKKQN